MRTAIVWHKIDAPNLHGYVATADTRKVEVVRAYAQDWRIFQYANGVMLRGPAESFGTMQAARRVAADWLRN